ncbi:MAG: recombinase family protein [Faecalibacterium sp.]|nr:recombinase family protein [Ruminococcus sp.]MCM1391301.1 recombinase family protein [Ruminococcus sp.]MCM1484855.1 recombinase family protein [Faecalibacterium sp.]
MKNLPYGYCFEKGNIAIQPQEQTIVTEIYDSYLSGKSLLNIAAELNAQSIEFMPGIIGWNKARLKHILENERYLGNDTYPAIITQETYDAVQEIKDARNTQKSVDRKADIFQITVLVRCPVCGSEMHRRSDRRVKSGQRWICKKDDCRKLIAVSDEELLRAITELLNRVIAESEGIHIPNPAVQEPSTELRRMNNEIGRTLEGYSIQKETLRKQLLQSVSLKYENIDNAVYIAKRLKADFANASPLSDFSGELFGRTVSELRLCENGSVILTLTNGQQIGKEQSDGINSSTTACENSTQNTADY